MIDFKMRFASTNKPYHGQSHTHSLSPSFSKNEKKLTTNIRQRNSQSTHTLNPIKIPPASTSTSNSTPTTSKLLQLLLPNSTPHQTHPNQKSMRPHNQLCRKQSKGTHPIHDQFECGSFGGIAEGEEEEPKECGGAVVGGGSSRDGVVDYGGS